jgi:hypothetical protein
VQADVDGRGGLAAAEAPWTSVMRSRWEALRAGRQVSAAQAVHLNIPHGIHGSALASHLVACYHMSRQGSRQAQLKHMQTRQAGEREAGSGAAGRVVQCARVGREATRSGDIRPGEGSLLAAG